MSNSNDTILAILTRVEAKVEKISDVQQHQALVLSEHTRRSTTNEDNLELLRQEFAPVKAHVAAVGVFGKICVGLLALAGGAATIYEAFLK